MKARPILEEERAALEARMDQEGHSCPFATHVFIDDTGAIVGAFSTACAPVLFFWMTTDKAHGMACVRAFQLANATFKALGHPRMLLPIQPDSPFHPFIKRLGFLPMGPVELHIKET